MKKQSWTKMLHAPRSMLYERGFTLVEFIVVISIVIFIIPSLFGLMYALLRQQSRVFALQDVKRQGDLVLNHMKTTIRNSAIGTYTGTLLSPSAVCTSSVAPNNTSSGSAMYFLDTSGGSNYFGYSVSGGGLLQYEKSGTTNTDLTNSSVTVSSLLLTCSRTSDISLPLVTVSFVITQPTTNVSLSYKTYIQLLSH